MSLFVFLIVLAPVGSQLTVEAHRDALAVRSRRVFLTLVQRVLLDLPGTVRVLCTVHLCVLFAVSRPTARP